MDRQERIRYKLRQYIEDDDLPRLEHYCKKHKVCVTSVKFETGNKPLHLACTLGYDSAARFLIEKGPEDLLVANDDKDIPIHLACYYATTHRHALGDLVLPLAEASPASLDVTNRWGVTARNLIEQLRKKHRLEESSTEDDLFDQEEKRWNERLRHEFEGEPYCSWRDSSHEEYFAQYTELHETWDEWADRVSSQYCHGWRRASDGSGKNRKRGPAENEKPESERGKDERPGISEERKREFDQKRRRIFVEERRSQMSTKKKDSVMIERKREYEEKCGAVFGTGGDESGSEEEQLGFRDIPWPLPLRVYSAAKKADAKSDKVGSDEKLVELFSCDFEYKEGEGHKSAAYRRYLKEQQIRWHPDKFLQKCGHRLKESDRQKILEAVNDLSQTLNRLVKYS